MRHLRLPLWFLTVLIAFIGVSLAALQAGTEIWSVALFTLFVSLVLSASLGLFVRKGRRRLAWAGFAAFGWTALVFMTQMRGNYLLPAYAMKHLTAENSLHALLAPPPAPKPDPMHANVLADIRYSLGGILFAAIGALAGLAVYTEPEPTPLRKSGVPVEEADKPG